MKTQCDGVPDIEVCFADYLGELLQSIEQGGYRLLTCVGKRLGLVPEWWRPRMQKFLGEKDGGSALRAMPLSLVSSGI